MSIVYSCSKWDGEYQTFYAKYQVFGGIAGMSWTTVEIFEDGNVIYTGHGQNGTESYTGMLNTDQQRKIYSVFMENEFFNLDSNYFTSVVFDDFHISLILKTETDSHRVIANQATVERSILPWKWRFEAICDSMFKVADLVKTNVEQAKVEVYSFNSVYQWPYDDLSQYIVNDFALVGIDQETHQYLDSLNQIDQTTSYVYIHIDSIVYNVVVDTSDYMRIYYPFRPIKWFLDTKLSEIGENGLMVYDEDYVNLIDSLNNSNYKYFYDSLTSEDAAIYRIKLTEGNYFEE